MMIVISLVIALLSLTEGLPTSGLQLLFPALRQYTYEIKTNISCGTLAPVESDSYWTLEGTVLVQVYDNYTRVRYTLGDLKTSIFSKHHGYVSYKKTEAAQSLQEPWEVDYQEDGNIDHLYVSPQEPLWATNMKRALSFNMQLKRDVGTYYNIESCLYQTYKDCQVVYVANGNTIRKYNALHILSENSGYNSWMSVPMDFSKAAFFGGPEAMYSGPGDYNGPLDNIGTADRTYELDDKIGLMSLDLKSVFQHKTRSHIMAVITELSLNYDSDAPLDKIDKLDLVKTNKQYVSRGYIDPTNGIRNLTQADLRNKTYEILLHIASKGIDADNIVRNASKIHSLDFVNLLKTMSQLDYAALHKLFEDMVLGTSYDIETSRNIFLEVLPHVRTNACALFIKYLVIEQKSKIEDATLLSLVRKLPFNVANHSQQLLEELEVFTRLGLDFSEDIRYAGILSFATLVYKAAEVRRVKQDYFDNIVVKYFRMYSDCPQYIDRLVWLQGLSNIQYSIENYMWTVYNNASFDRHERFWAILATTPVFAPTGYAATWHILMNEKEHIQIRIAALHSILSSKIRPSELLSIHNYILGCKDQQLKRFWYTTVKSLDSSKTYNGYRVASNYIPFLTNQVNNPDSKYWATGNHIVGTYDEETATGAMLQLLSVGDPASGLPALLQLRVKTVSELMATSDVGIFIKAEGVATNMFQKIHSISSEELDVGRLVEVLRKMKVQTVTPEKVHIEIVLKIHDKTVYATHFNQSRFDSWNGEDLTKSIEDFLRFGSHINQQVVYYPFQLDANIPTELGTPVRLQTALVSFSSVRGNLTAPSTHDLTWRNDLHFRYQGTAVTSLSTDGPLLQSEHTARVQQSVVAHVPMKFEVFFSPMTRSFELRWPNPTAQNAGLAMHSRAQIAMESLKGKDTYTISAAETQTLDDETGLFFDCDRPMTMAELIEKLLASNTASYDFLTKLRPSVLLLNGLLLLSAPPSGSCGLVVGGRKPKAEDTMLKLLVHCEELSLIPDEKVIARVANHLVYSENRPNGEVFLNVSSLAQFESVGGNATFDLQVSGDQPYADDDHPKRWKIGLKQQDVSHGPIDQDITPNPVSYDGYLTLTFTADEKVEGSQFLVQYKGAPNDKVDNGLERYFEVKLSGSKLPRLEVLAENGLGSHPALGQVLRSFEQDPLNVTAVVKEKNGLASVAINAGRPMRLKLDSFAWLLDSWSNMQVMEKFGIYRECRVYESTVLTLSGVVERLPPLQCAESLALADCSDNPRFAVLRTKEGGVKLYTGGHSVLVSQFKDKPLIIINGDVVGCEHGCSFPEGQMQADFKITILGEVTKVHSRVSGVQVFHRAGETVILAPHSYMSTVCGSCTSQHYYKLC
ncbi:uncharacterized protein LOC105390424 [Plutella xylostella]|uniref:uncharacterized protein LOC105390424 n=1 Tax=Plutella xylostella TaxID=51655 RepID=UPI00203264E8|nr:uncharacterized protein LOC105390424 [Plutella xylostella]XP_048485920.1 uncharacterized protein LOC105390424 [Plutella xylostella]